MKKWVFAALVLGIAVKLGYLHNPFAGEPEFVQAYQGKVVLYSTSWCGYCKKTRELFAEKSIEYLEYDVEKSSLGQSQYKKLKGRGVPLILMGGETIRGYDREAILRLVDQI